MTALLVLLAIAVAAGGVVAVAAPNPRHAVLGASGAAFAAAFVSDPLSDPAAVVARATGAALAGWLLWVAVRDAPRATERSALRLPGSAAVAMVALVAGWFAALALVAQLAAVGGDASPAIAGAALAAGSPVAIAALGTAFAIVAVAASPVLAPRDGLRLGLGAMLLVIAAELAVAAVGRGTDRGAAVAFGVLVAGGGAALAAIASVMLRQTAGFALREPQGHELVAHRSQADAHRVDGA